MFFLNVLMLSPKSEFGNPTIHGPVCAMTQSSSSVFPALAIHLALGKTDKRPNLGCQSNVSRKGMCVKGISGIFFLFTLFSWLWQDRKWDDPHVGLSLHEWENQVSFTCAYALRCCICFCQSVMSTRTFWVSSSPFYRGGIRENEVFVLCTKCKEVPESP